MIRPREQPNEPASSTFKDRIKLAGYPASERSGMVWVYMGPRAEPLRE